jgi:hypothetical protein
MATRLISKTWKVSGVLTNVTSAKLSDPTGTYGVKRNDTNAVVVADGTDMTSTAVGTYEYSFTDVQDIAYTAYIEIVYSGAIYYFEIDLPAHADVNAMTVSYSSLLERVGHFLFGLRTGFSSDQTDDIEMCIEDGLRRVYTAHNWSFFRPVKTITTASGTYSYALPTGYESIETEMHYAPGESDFYPPVRERHDSEVRKLQQDNEDTDYDRPRYFSVRTVEFDRTVGSRKQLILYPTPDAIYVLYARMTLRPVMIDDTHQYPVGGEQLAAVILESCLYSAEVNMDDNVGLHAKQFMELLPLAIQADLLSSSPRTLGSDAPSGEPYYDLESRKIQMGAITFDGTIM